MVINKPLLDEWWDHGKMSFNQLAGVGSMQRVPNGQNAVSLLHEPRSILSGYTGLSVFIDSLA
jgi:hypothetical protein